MISLFFGRVPSFKQLAKLFITILPSMQVFELHVAVGELTEGPIDNMLRVTRHQEILLHMLYSSRGDETDG